MTVAQSAGSGIITTIAGTEPVYRGLPPLALNAPLGTIQWVTVASDGTLYAVDSDQSLVVSISPSGAIAVVAGNGISGYSGDGGPANQAGLARPSSVAVDSSGQVFIAEQGSFRIRKVSNGLIQTIAGNGTPFSSNSSNNNPQPAAGAAVNPYAIVVDPTGNLYFSDGNTRVRKISKTGTLTTIAGTGNGGNSGDGGLATAATFQQISGLAYDPRSGFIYVADAGSNRIRRFLEGGTISAFAGTGVSGYSGDGGPAAQAQFSFPYGLCVDSSGNVYVADNDNGVVRKIDASLTVTTVAGNQLPAGAFGDGGPATSAALGSPAAVALDTAGNLYIADSNNDRVRKVSGGTITTVAGSGTYRYGGDGGPAVAALFSTVIAAAFDGAGNLYIADASNSRIRKVDASGTVTTVVGNGQVASAGDGGSAANASLAVPSGVAFDSAGNMYVTELDGQKVRKITPNGTISTIAGNGTAGFSGDGGPATQAALLLPLFVAVDGPGNVYFLDYENHRIRMVTPAGIISTVAGNGQTTTSGDNGPAINAGMSPSSLGVTSSGVIYLGDGSNIRKVVNGTISTVANIGGGFINGQIAIDASGDLIGCGGNKALDKGNGVGMLSPSGAVSDIVNGGRGFSGDGGPAINAQVKCFGVLLDSAGTLYIADGDNNRVRKISSVAPSLSVSPTAISFTATEGTNATAQRLDVSGTSGALLSATASTTAGGSWLSVSPGGALAPAAFGVSVNSAVLTPGTYQGSISIQSAGPALAVSVTLTVNAPAAGQLTASPSTIAVQAVAGASSSVKQGISIGNSGGGTLNWTATTATTDGASWLNISPASGTTQLLVPSVSQVSLSAQNLKVGVYSGSITFNPGSVVVAVRLTVSASGATLLVGQSGLVFNGTQGGAALAAQSVNIANSSSGTLNWTATAASGSWLAVSPPSGSSTPQSPGSVQVQANVGGLSAGTYYGLVQISASGAVNSPQYITVVLNVAAAATTRLPVSVYPLGVILTANQGQNNGASIQLFTASLTAVPVSVTANGSFGGTTWLTASAQGPSLNPANTVNVSVNSGGLNPGIYQGTVTLVFGDGSPAQDVTVVMVVPKSSSVAPQRLGSSPGATGCTPANLLMVMRQLGSNFSSPVGWPVDLEAQLVDDCGNPALSAAVVASFSSGDAPLALSSLGGGIYSATWNPANAKAATVTVRGVQQPFAPVVATLSGQATTNPAPPPSIGAGGVVNGASFAPATEVAPGTIVSVFGTNLASSSGTSAGSFPLPFTLAGIKLTIGGIDAPLFYAGEGPVYGQVNAQVPFEVAPGSQIQVVARAISASGAEVDGVPSPLTIGVARPGIFITSGTQGAILDVSYKLIDGSNPAKVLDVIQIYCTGLGATSPAAVTGQAAGAANAVLQPTVTVGGAATGVQYAGLAPGYVGLYQVNVAIPAGITVGPAVPVVITQNGIASNAGTIAVH